jgi:hypothetical protein
LYNDSSAKKLTYNDICAINKNDTSFIYKKNNIDKIIFNLKYLASNEMKSIRQDLTEERSLWKMDK